MGPACLHFLSCLVLWALVRGSADTAAALPPAPGKPEVLFRHVRAWADFTRPLAVLRLAQPPSALHYVPGWRDSSPPRFLSVGDSAGGLLLLSPGGQLLAQHATGTGSPVTALSSYRLGRNTTVLLSGHASGELRLHLLHHPPAPSGSGDSGWEAAEDEWEAATAAGTGSGAPLRMSLMHALPPEALLCGCSSGGATGTCTAIGEQAPAASGDTQAASAMPAAGSPPRCPPITAVHASGRGGNVASTAVVVDAAGALAVLKHGGAAYRGVRILRRSVLAQHPVALRLPPLAAVATVLSSQGSATQRLGPAAAAAMPDHNAAAQPASGTEAVPPGFEAGPTVRPCSSLNGSRIVAAAFDAVHSSRAYAVADDGRLLALVVGGSDRGAPAGCTARTAASLPAALAQAALAGASAGGSSTHSSGSSALLHGAVNMAALPGYVLMTAGDQLAVFNVSSAPRRAPRLLLQQHLPLLLRQLGSVGSTASGGQQGRGQGQAGQAEGQAGPAPLLAAGHTHVAVTLGARTLALFEASLPYRLPAQPYRTSLAWMQLFQPFAMVLVAAFVLHRARSKRGGGGGGRKPGGGGGFGGDARLREFERLLQDPMAGATAPRRHRPGWLGSGSAGDSSDSGGSDVEDSQLGTLSPNTRSIPAGNAQPAARQRGGLFGPRTASSSGATAGKARQAQRQRAAALAAADDADIRALRAELAGSGLGPAELAGQAADVDMAEPAPAELGDEVSVLRRRLNQAHL